MVNTEQLAKATELWYSPDQQKNRLYYLRELAKEGDILEEFNAIPEIHLKNMTFTEYSITLQGLAKIRALHAIAFNTKP